MTDVKHPLDTDIVSFVDGMPPEWRMVLCHIICCHWCRLHAVNVIQSSKVGYPDLFADPSGHGD